MSARAAERRETIASAWRSSSSPASVSETFGALRVLDELLADDPLEGRDLLADRGLRVAERDGGATERRLTGDGLQRDQVAKLDAEPTIRIHDGKIPKLDLC